MPSQEEEKPSYRVAGLLAFHLVSQVLDEAHIVANAAIESGHPWDYLSMRKNMRSDLTYVISPGEVKYANPPGDYIEAEDTSKLESNVPVTSTPQKIADEKPKMETLIGQGDEEVERQNELSNSTSMFINHLFDMSDVEQNIDVDTEVQLNVDENFNQFTQAMKLMGSNENTTIATVEYTQKEEVQELADNKGSTTNSSFSLIVDDLIEGQDTGKDVKFYVDNHVLPCTENVSEMMQDPMTSQRALQYDALKEVKVENRELYENAYLTMNRKLHTAFNQDYITLWPRTSKDIKDQNQIETISTPDSKAEMPFWIDGDYDQCSDEDGYPVLQDPKGMMMQEIELLTADTSDDASSPHNEEAQSTEKGNLAATSAVSASSRKSGLVAKCRLQGARLLACIRGWWRRKTPGKRKEVRVPGSRRGVCPLSPSARRRAASLLDHHRSPVPGRGAWKFNTLNEALVNSSVWKDYTFETDPRECGDV